MYVSVHVCMHVLQSSVCVQKYGESMAAELK